MSTEAAAHRRRQHSPVRFLGWQIADTSGFLALGTVVAVIGCLAFWLPMRAPFGRLLPTVREDELAAPLRQLIYGVLLIAFAAFRSQGLFGERS